MILKKSEYICIPKSWVQSSNKLENAQKKEGAKRHPNRKLTILLVKILLGFLTVKCVSHNLVVDFEKENVQHHISMSSDTSVNIDYSCIDVTDTIVFVAYEGKK